MVVSTKLADHTTVSRNPARQLSVTSSHLLRGACVPAGRTSTLAVSLIPDLRGCRSSSSG
ncbi:hypothetical protein ACFQ0B_52505 [Nonomuraea thailandensis]